MNDLVLFLIILFVGSKIVRRLKIEMNPIKAISVALITTGIVLLLLSYSLYRPMYHTNIIGGSIPIIPLLIGIVSIIFASFIIIKKQQPGFKSDEIKSNKYHWLLFCFVCLLISLSKNGFLLSIYTPSFYKSSIAIPQLGVGIVLVGSVINATILHFISRFRDNKLPQSFFGISFMTVI